MMKITVLLIAFIVWSFSAFAQQLGTVNSPDGRLKITLTDKPGLVLSAMYSNKQLLDISEIALRNDRGNWDGSTGLKRTQKENVNSEVLSPIYKRSNIPEQYNALELEFKKGYSLHIRVYNNGFAYRWVTGFKGTQTVLNENFQLNFPTGTTGILQTTNTYDHSYEGLYLPVDTDTLSAKEKVTLPAIFSLKSGLKLAMMESDLYDYPGLYLVKSDRGLQSTFPACSKTEVAGDYNGFALLPAEREDYIAKTTGTRSFPWRVFQVAEQDKELLDSDLVYLLARKPSDGKDFNWVEPGKVAWDWWYNWNLTGVDFESGVNTATFKYFVDFAAENKLHYINLDWYWCDPFDLTKSTQAASLPEDLVVPVGEIDAQEIIRYATSKGIKVIVWCTAATLDKQLYILDTWEEWGVAGLKIDFITRDDQKGVNWYERFAGEAAARKMTVNFHGAMKPAGLRRAYPNVLNYEAVRGLEHNKFNPLGATPEQAVHLPFTRMLAGPMDYTPGAIDNAQAENWRMIFNTPMSQGTRCHQLAMYVVYEMPLAMLSDSPTRYETDNRMLGDLADVPTTWDETIALDGKIGKYAIIARRKGDIWCIGGITGWEARSLELDLSQLFAGKKKAVILKDGANADRIGSDYVREEMDIDADVPFEVDLAAGGGFLMIIGK